MSNYTSPPPPSVIKPDLYSIQRLAVRLAITYQGSHDDGYLGVRKPNSDGTPKPKGSHSDPTADIAISDHHSHIRANVTQAANDIAIAHRHLVAALKLLEDHTANDGLDIGM